MQQRIQVLEKEVTQAGQAVKISDDLDITYKKLTGIAFLDSVGLGSVLLSSSVNNDELLPKNMEVVFLQSNVFVAPDERFFTLHDFKAEGSKIDLEYKDGGNASSYPYTLKVYLRLEGDAFEN